MRDPAGLSWPFGCGLGIEFGGRLGIVAFLWKEDVLDSATASESIT
jgi:hypothetical protein